MGIYNEAAARWLEQERKRQDEFYGPIRKRRDKVLSDLRSIWVNGLHAGELYDILRLIQELTESPDFRLEHIVQRAEEWWAQEWLKSEHEAEYAGTTDVDSDDALTSVKAKGVTQITDEQDAIQHSGEQDTP